MREKIDPCASDNRLQAFIDGELDKDEERKFLEALEQDAALRDQVARMRLAKDWVRQAFEDVEPPENLPHIPAERCMWRHLPALAAGLFLLISGMLLGNLFSQEQRTIDSIVLDNPAADPYRVVLHIGYSDPEKFRETLDDAESLLRKYTDGNMRVEILAHAGGIDLLRADVSPYVQRVADLMSRYDGKLTFIACANAIKRVEERGEKVILIGNVYTGTTAIDHVIRRLREGWTYVKI